MSLFFIETPTFTQRVTRLGLEEELRALQNELRINPLAGRTDTGTGGLRKVRLGDGRRHKGKRSGARAHYLYLSMHDVIYLMFVYAKDEQSSLTAQQKRRLATIVAQIKAEWTSDRTTP